MSESLDVNAIVKEIEGMVHETFPRSIITSTELRDKLPRIVGDPSQIHQIVLNLAVNARDAMPKGGKLMIRTSVVDGATASATNASALPCDHVLLEVQDTGSGMDERTREKIFEPFFTTKEAGKGTGLGLSVVFGIVNQLRGFIAVESGLGSGTTFRLYLPVNDASESSNRVIARGPMAERRGTETILLIEDEDVLRDLVGTVLSSMGYNVLTADDGLKGIAMFKSRRTSVDLVITDFGLPGVDGLEVSRQIMEIEPLARITVASGFLEPSVKATFQEMGITTFVQKPYSRDDLLSTVASLLDATSDRRTST